MAGLCVKEENRALFGVLNPMFIPPLQLMKNRSYKGRWQEGHSRADCAAAISFIISKHCRRSYKKQRCETSNGENWPDSNLLILSNQVDG